MNAFILYMVVNGMVAGVATYANRFLPNRVRIRCMACGAKLYQHPSTKRWAFIDTLIWMLVAWLVIWRAHLPVPIAVAFVLPLAFAWRSAVKRSMQVYFLWRHPIRCQGDGHVAPVPEVA